MALPSPNALVDKLCPPLDRELTVQLVDQFVDMERRYVQCDWGPAELDGGRFCEALSRLLYHQDSGNLRRDLPLNEALQYVETEANHHRIVPRTDAKHLARVVRCLYHFRNTRGVAHLSSTYSANQMDARLVLELGRWCMNEALRIFASGDREQLASIIREVLRFDVPAIGVFGGRVLVQRTDLSAEEEILVLLHYAGESGSSRLELGRNADVSAASVTRALQRLVEHRQVALLPDDRYCLTDLGTRRVRLDLGQRLLAG